MNREETIAIELLSGKADLSEISVEELERLATRHPYFSAAQLLLSKKMMQINDSGLQKQLYKTALYFPDEQWLRYLLAEAVEKKNEAATQSDSEAEQESDTSGNVNVSALLDADEALDTEEINTAITEGNQPYIKPDEIEDNNLITLPAAEIADLLFESGNMHDEPEEAPLDDEELHQQSEPLPIEESNQKIANILQEQAEVFHKPVDQDEGLPIAAEPFHAVDYFASQGIRLEAKKEETSFDKKVLTFTDWLRQMKRINPHPVDLGTDMEEENYVVNTAATSNFTKDIITESMAEVLLKQDKKEKAIEVYQKLGLLYPDKNAYFAAKIHELNIRR